MTVEHNKNKKGFEHASTADVAGEAVATDDDTKTRDDDTKTRKVKRTIGRDCLAGGNGLANAPRRISCSKDRPPLSGVTAGARALTCALCRDCRPERA